MLPTNTTLENNKTVHYNLADIEQAVINHITQVEKALDLSFDTKISLSNVDCNSNYSEYYVTFVDQTWRGVSKPYFKEDLTLSEKDIKKLLTQSN